MSSVYNEVEYLRTSLINWLSRGHHSRCTIVKKNPQSHSGILDKSKSARIEGNGGEQSRAWSNNSSIAVLNSCIIEFKKVKTPAI